MDKLFASGAYHCYSSLPVNMKEKGGVHLQAYLGRLAVAPANLRVRDYYKDPSNRMDVELPIDKMAIEGENKETFK